STVPPSSLAQQGFAPARRTARAFRSRDLAPVDASSRVDASGGSLEAQRLDARGEGRRLHPETRGGSLRAGDLPAGRVERAQQVLALELLELPRGADDLAFSGAGRARGSRSQARLRDGALE